MKPIQETLKNWINDNDAFTEKLDTLKTQILSNPAIKQFLANNPDISQAEINRKLSKLHEYMSKSIQCNQCHSLQNCKNELAGYSPVLQNSNGEIIVSYVKCNKKLESEKQYEDAQLIRSLYMPKEILEANMKNIFVDQGRVQAVKEIDTFLEEAKGKIPERGLYLTGSFGVGKTYLLGAIANELRKRNISSSLIYMPEFVREMREAIQTNTVSEKIDAFKTADVLMIDDIGAETFSAWFRDEVLGTILQYRMMERLPVFFTSNYTVNELENILSTSTSGNIEKIKAGRIIERIKRVSKEVFISGKNYRE